MLCPPGGGASLRTFSVRAAHGDFLAKTAGRKEEKITTVQKPDRPALGDPGDESC